jgi:solute carrier family 25 carnitine/acylcarnitine transporter 20/29
MDIDEATGVESGVYLERRRTLLLQEKAVADETAAADSGTTMETTVSPFATESLVAGYVAGVCGVLIGHPLDSIKVLLQLQIVSNGQGTTRTKVAEPSRALTLSFRQLFAGVQGPLLTVGFIQALNFGIYDSCRQYLKSRRQDSNNSDQRNYPSPHTNNNFEVALSALTASSVISLPTGLLQVIKIRQQQNPNLSFQKAAKMSLQWSTVQAMTPHFLCETLGRTVYLTSYEWFKRLLVAFRQFDLHQFEESTAISSLNLTMSERMVCAGLSGTLSWTIIFPLDVLRSRMFAVKASNDGPTQPTSTWEMALSMYKKEGWRPFTRGMSMAVLRAAPVAAVVLPIYDVTHQWLLLLG